MAQVANTRFRLKFIRVDPRVIGFGPDHCGTLSNSIHHSVYGCRRGNGDQNRRLYARRHFCGPRLLTVSGTAQFYRWYVTDQTCDGDWFYWVIAQYPLNWIFVYGKFGAPELGGVGCGVATAIVYWIMLLLLLFYIVTSKRLAHVKVFETFHKPQPKELIRLFRLGFPVAAALFLK